MIHGTLIQFKNISSSKQVVGIWILNCIPNTDPDKLGYLWTLCPCRSGTGVSRWTSWQTIVASFQQQRKNRAGWVPVTGQAWVFLHGSLPQGDKNSGGSLKKKQNALKHMRKRTRFQPITKGWINNIKIHPLGNYSI